VSGFYSKVTAPIAGDDPFGVDVNYDLDYERLKNEMGKLGDIDADLVESLSVKILTEKSKDARALAFLAYSMLRKNDFGRLADVFCALAVFCQDDFERIYPRRESAKAAALRWFSEARFSGQCEKAVVTAADAQDTARFEDAVSKLRSTLDKRFSDSAPPLSLLHKRAGEWKKTAENAMSQPVCLAEPPFNTDDAKNTGGGSVNNQQKPVGNDEYQEILQCIKKIETFIINLKHGTVV
jgi:predicted component of type VI protein secretion system